MYTTAFLIALIVGIIEAIKRAFNLDKAYLPLISLVLGIGAAFLAQNGLGLEIRETIIFGIMIGLSSAGLFSGFKSIIYVANRIGKRTK